VSPGPFAVLAAALGAAVPFAGADPAVRPQDDLFRHANGQWLSITQIPGHEPRYGSFTILSDKAEERVRSLLEGFVASPGRDPEARLLGDLYASLTDEAAIAASGLGSARAELARIARLGNMRDVSAAMGRLAARGVGMPIGAWVGPDDKRPDVYSVRLNQGGLGLPDRDYYLKDGAEAEALRADYRDYLAGLGGLAGLADASASAAAAVAFETELAKVSLPNEARRDPRAMYNPATRQALSAQYGPFPLEPYFGAVGMPRGQGAIVGERPYFLAFGKLANTTGLNTWKAYLSLRLVDNLAPYLAAPYRDAHQAFKGARLDGLAAAPPRWKNAVQTLNWTVGEAVGKHYVARHFPPAAKRQARDLVDHVLAAFRAKVYKLPWMGPATRREAKAKLAKLRVKIGYPEKWRTYKGLKADRGDVAGNLLGMREFVHRRDMADAGRKVDRGRWWMPPQIVNAYYDPSMNEIVFPAAILEDPFFDPEADPAYNYGGIGGIIGHEISHGFDDQGRQYDAHGKLRDWWTAADARAFEARTAALTAQYGAYEPQPGEKINGKLTLGENIADLSGLSAAHAALHLALDKAGRPAATRQEADRKFFLGWARIWRSKDRPEFLRQRLLIDPHSPEEFRTNGVVCNMDAFYRAFGVKPGDALYRAPEDRVAIW